MLNSFNYSLYRILNDKTTGNFESIFLDTWSQLNIYRRQFQTTLESYQKEQDSEIKELELDFSKKIATAKEIYAQLLNEQADPNDHDAEQYAAFHSGIDHLDESLFSHKEEITQEYQTFFDLYCKSIVVALYSLHESKLREITEVASDIFGKKIKPKHFDARDYLNSSLQYLELVVELDVASLDQPNSKFKLIQNFRNSIVHNRAKITEKSDLSEVLKEFSSSLLKTSDQVVIIRDADFVNSTFKILNTFYGRLFFLIDSKQEFNIIQNGLLYWLRVMDREITIEKFEMTRNVSASKINLHFLVRTIKDTIAPFECKISIEKSTVDSFSSVNQCDDSPELAAFLKFESSQNNMKEIFKPFLNENAIKVDIITY